MRSPGVNQFLYVFCLRCSISAGPGHETGSIVSERHHRQLRIDAHCCREDAGVTQEQVFVTVDFEFRIDDAYRTIPAQRVTAHRMAGAERDVCRLLDINAQTL